MANFSRIFELPKRTPPASQPSRRFTDESRIGTIIGKGVEITGEVKGNTDLELRGSIRGSTDLQGLLVIREGGSFAGEVAATNVVVEGHIEGNVTAHDSVELRASCRVMGDIQANSVAIAEGSFFEGKVHMQGREASKAKLSFQEKRALPGPRDPAIDKIRR